MENPISFLAILIAFFASGLVGAIGGGGGLLTLPLLLFFGIPPQVAIATNKFAIMSGMPAAIWNFARNRKIVWHVAAFVIPAAMVGGFCGTQILLQIEEATAQKIIILLLPIALISSFLPRRNSVAIKKTFLKIELYFFAPLLGLVTGIYQGIFGPATGTWIILSLRYFLKFDFVRAAATTKVISLASGSVSLVIFILAGKVWWTLALPAAVACFLGNFCGSHLAIKKGDKFIRLIVTFTISTLLVLLVWKTFVK